MLEQVIDVFINRIRQTVITDDKMTYVPLGYLMTLDIPQSIKHFFDQEVELWIREEEEKFSGSDRFNYDLPEVRVLIDQIFDILKQTAQFHVTKFNQLLERAVKLQMNFVIEPHRTLTQFLFKDGPIISTIEVYDILKYFFQFEYYKEAISDYFNTKYLKQISQDQFVELLNRIDEKVFSENRVEMTLKVVKTIMNFLSEARGTQITSLPVNVLCAALRDRNLTDLAEIIEEAQREVQMTELSFEEIEGILFGRLEGAPEQPAEKVEFDQLESLDEQEIEISVDDIDVGEAPVEAEKAEEIEEIEEVEPEDIELEEEQEEIEEEVEEKVEEEEEELEEIGLEEKPGVETEEEIEIEEEVEPEEEVEAEEEIRVVQEPEEEVAEEMEEEPEEEAAEAVEEEAAEEQTEVAEETEEVEVKSKVAEDLAEHLAKQISSDQPLEDLHTMVKGRLRRKIIKKLFRKDEQAFNEFIDRINGISTWKEASHFIDDTFYELNINPYSKEAITFSDIVYMRYFPKDKYIGAKLEEDRF
ncbi:MAG: hypothetical protein GXO77_11825 [Calditrichaeota bacterium]|nr:hypothetical protein [Calditrichota bacterium]